MEVIGEAFQGLSQVGSRSLNNLNLKWDSSQNAYIILEIPKYKEMES